MVTLKDINLMPKRAVSKREKEKLLKSVLVFMAIIIGISAIMDLGIWFVKDRYTKKIEDQKAQIAQLLGAETDLASLNLIQKKIGYRDNVLKKIDVDRLKITNFINKLEELAPKDISIVKFEIDKKGDVILQGQGSKEEAVLDFYHNLKANKLGDYITFNTMTGALGESQFDFSFKFKLTSGK